MLVLLWLFLYSFLYLYYIHPCSQFWIDHAVSSHGLTFILFLHWIFRVSRSSGAAEMKRFLRSGHDSVRERLKRDLFQFNKVMKLNLGLLHSWIYVYKARVLLFCYVGFPILIICCAHTVTICCLNSQVKNGFLVHTWVMVIQLRTASGKHTVFKVALPCWRVRVAKLQFWRIF